MPQYTEKAFLEQARKSPLFKNLPKKPGKKDLKRLRFSKEFYTEDDLILLRDLFVGAKNDIPLQLPKRLDQAFRTFIQKISPTYLLIANGKRKTLSLISILYLSPDFENKIKGVRSKYKIDPKKLKKAIYSSFPKNQQKIVSNELESETIIDDRFPKHASEASKSSMGLIKEYIDRITGVRERINKIVSRKYPRLSSDIASILERYGLPIQYEVYLRDFILFERVSPGDVLPVSDTRRFQEKPDFQLNLSKEQVFTNSLENSREFRPHISIKIYGSTNIDSVHSLVKMVYAAGAPRFLPTYNFKKTIPDLDAETILRKALLYYLQQVQKLKTSEIVELFRYLGKPVKKNNISRDIRAFKKVFRI